MSAAPFIRRATKDDLPAVARLAAKLVRQHHAMDPRRFMCEEPVEPGYERWLHHEISNPKTVLLVAERDVRQSLPREPSEGRPAAIVGYAYGKVEPRDWNALLEACGWLHDVYVDEEARRGGVGAALVEATAQALRAMGAPRMMLHTASQNSPAQRMFEKLGFRRTMVEMARELE